MLEWLWNGYSSKKSGQVNLCPVLKTPIMHWSLLPFILVVDEKYIQSFG